MVLSDFVKDMIFARKIEFGRGKFKFMGVKGFILPTYTVFELLGQVYRALGDDLYDIAFKTGKGHGKYAVDKQGREYGMGKQEFIEGLVDAANIMGIGKIDITSFDPKKEILEVKFKDSVTHKVAEDHDLDPQKCLNQFVRGIYHGMAEEVFNSDQIESKIEDIARKGDRAVKISIRPVKN